MAISVTACNAGALLIFTLLLNYTTNFWLVFASYCVVGFFSYPFVPVSLEYAADLTYPISEGLSSTILFTVTNLYGTITIFAMDELLQTKGSAVAGYVMVGMYVCSLLFLLFIKGNLNRYDIDRAASLEPADKQDEGDKVGG